MAVLGVVAGVAGTLVSLGAIAAPPTGAASIPLRRLARLSAPEGLVQVGAAGRALPGEHPSGAVTRSRVLTLGVAFRPRDPAGLVQLATEVSTPGSRWFHHYLTPSEFAARFGPTRSEVVSLEGFLRRAGLSVGAPSANGLVVPVEGTAGRIEAAFHTRLAAYRSSTGASVGWAAQEAPRLPAELARAVTGVLGLDDLVVPHAMLRRAPTAAERDALRAVATTGRTSPRAATEARAAVAHGKVPAHQPTAPSTTHAPTAAPVACGAAADAARGSGGWTDTQVATAYGLKGLYAAGDVGAGQTIALYELEPFSMADVAAFDRCYFGVSHTSQITTVPVDGFGLAGAGSGEALLDIEDVSALAPAARIVVYEGPNTTFGGIDAFNTIVSEDQASLVSTSWGECEAAVEVGAPGAQQLEATLFEEAAAQGQTVFAAAGDTGSDDCASTPFSSTVPAPPYLSVDDPASQPYVVAVGGTSLLSATNPPAQTVWNDGAKWGGGGGGISSTWPSPPWQAGSGIPGVNPSAGRQLPDVTATADEWRGVTVYSAAFASTALSAGSRGRPSSSDASAGWTTIGGTSSAAPTWAAVAADIAASPACSSLPAAAGSAHDLGFVAPELYDVAASPTAYVSSFSDVARGSNDVFGLGLGYKAGPGFDLASGLGAPIVTDAAGRGGLDESLCAVASAAGGGSPKVASLTPSSGPVAGGTTVTIGGSGFPAGDPGVVRVTFGQAPAQVVAVPSSTTLVVTTSAAPLPSGSASFAGAGPVQVVVTVGHGTSRPGPASTFDYVATASLPPSAGAGPAVTGIGPSGVNAAGGVTVTVYGDGFSASDPPTVTFGGVPATGVRVVSPSEIAAVVPPESRSTRCATGPGFSPATACQVEVVVSDAAGTSPTAPILPAVTGTVRFDPKGVVEPPPGTEVAPAATELDYAPTPVITSVSPNPGDAKGTLPVVIRGSGFDFDTLYWVNFGPPRSVSSEQVDLASVTPNEIVIDPPPASGPTGADVQPLRGGISVQTAGGLSNAVAFSYAGVPKVSRLSSLGGPSTGGTRLVVDGTGLAGTLGVELASQVSADGYGASVTIEVSHVSATSLTLVTPADLPGPVDVLPCTASGCARPDPRRDTFIYYTPAAPAVARMLPRSGPAQGGTAVTLYGDNLNGAVAVRFGRSGSSSITPARDYPDGDPYVVHVLSSPGAAGTTVPVTVVTRGGRSRPVVGGRFHYLPSPPSAPRGLHVAVSGRTATIRWSAPRSDGGRRITGYTALALAPGAPPRTVPLPASARSATVTGLLAGRSYELRVAATSVLGRGLWAAAGPLPVAYASNGYRVATTAGAVVGFGSLPGLGGVEGSTRSPVVAMAATTGGTGYWLVEADGTVEAFGDATLLGFPSPRAPLVAIAADPDAPGYWLLDRAGHVYAYGAAKSLGSLSPVEARSPAVGIAADRDGHGYWILTANGAVTAFGSASHHGGAAGPVHGATAVAITRRPQGPGYLVLDASGTVHGYGGAPVYGYGAVPVKGCRLPLSGTGSAVGIASTANGTGYWVLTSAGTVCPFGDARYEGHPSLSSGVSSSAIAAG